MTLARSEPRSEIIEVIDDDRDAFSPGASSQPSLDVARQRRTGVVAAAMLLALIGYGVATSAASSDARRAASVTTTSLASAAVPSTAMHPEAVPYYAADPPRSFTLQYANVQLLDHAPFLGYGYELWATNDASATSGSWFSVMTYRGASTIAAPDAYTVQTDQTSIAISHLEGGHTITQFTVDKRFSASITSFGWTDEDLVRLAESVQTDGSHVAFTDTWFTSDHQMLTSVQPWLAVQSIPAEQLSYVSADDPTDGIVITVGKRLQTFEGGGRHDRHIALRFLLDHNTPFDIDGRSAFAGMIVGQADNAMATWVDGDNIVTVTAALPLPQLIAIARTVHQVSSVEWEEMRIHLRSRR